MTNDNWKLLQAVVANFRGVSPATLDYIAVVDILKCCVSGMSNYSIADLMALTEEEVEEILSTFLEYSGNEDDLHYSAYTVFLDYAGLDNSYELFMNKLLPVESKKTLDKMWKMCYNVSAIEKEVDKYYAKD